LLGCSGLYSGDGKRRMYQLADSRITAALKRYNLSKTELLGPSECPIGRIARELPFSDT